MSLAIEHERLGYLIISLAHEGFLHLILNILYLDILFDIQVTDNL